MNVSIIQLIWGLNTLKQFTSGKVEELEEAIEEMKELIINKKRIWYYLKDYDPKSGNVGLLQSMGFAEGRVENSMKELAQVGAVLMKIKNTFEVKE